MFEKVKLTPLGLSTLIRLARSPGKEFYLRELVSEMNASLGGLQKVLKDLERKKLLESRKSGRNIHYRAIEGHPAITNLKVAVNILELEPLISELRGHCVKAYLFGSCATGEDTMESDVDMLIITEEPDVVRRLVKKVESSRTIKPIVHRPHEHMKAREKDPAFYENVEKGILLCGG